MKMFQTQILSLFIICLPTEFHMYDFNVHTNLTKIYQLVQNLLPETHTHKDMIHTPVYPYKIRKLDIKILY
jgi:hypothetical protein